MSFTAARLAILSILWTVLIPGLVAGYVPWRFFRLRLATLDPGNSLAWLGLAAVLLGALLLLACVWEFARSGRGTLAPVNAPEVLVVRGLYRYVRNPMYLAVTLILLGEALLVRSSALLIYWAIWFLAVNLLVLGYEEPTLRRRFGEDYVRYREAVHRWLPRRPRRPTLG